VTVAPSQERASRQVRSGRVNRRPPGFVATLVALAIVFALAWVFFVRSGSSVPTPRVDGVQGRFTRSLQPSPTPAVSTGDFGLVSSGDGRGAERAGSGQGGQPETRSAYDAATRTETARTEALPDSGLRRTVGFWPPVWRLETPSPLDYQGLAAIVRAAVEDGDRAVGIKPLKQGDRAVWRAAMRMDGKAVDVVVDQRTGIVTWCADGTETFTADVDWESPPPAGATWSVAAPAGTPVNTVKAGGVSYAASPAAAGKDAGYDALVSGLAPDGFSLKAVATREESDAPSRWLDGTGGAPLPGSPEAMIMQLYTRGLGWFTMEQIGPKAAEQLGRELADALTSAAPTELSFQETTLQYGAFEGETASTWYQPSGPSLFVKGARRAVFVTGALTRRELIAYAEGLRPEPAGR
jgi:hypothetical protein